MTGRMWVQITVGVAVLAVATALMLSSHWPGGNPAALLQAVTGLDQRYVVALTELFQEKRAQMAGNVSFTLEITWARFLGLAASVGVVFSLGLSIFWFRSAVGVRRTPGFKQITARPSNLAADSIRSIEQDEQHQLLATTSEYETGNLFREVGTGDITLPPRRQASLEVKLRLSPPEVHPALEKVLYRGTTQLLGQLDETEFTELFDDCEWIVLDESRILFNCGDPCDSGVYVIVSGELSATIGGVDPVSSFLLTPGETVGELSLITNTVRTMTVSARRKSELLRISKEVFDEICRSKPHLLAGFTRTTLARSWRICKFTMHDYFGIPWDISMRPLDLLSFFGADSERSAKLTELASASDFANMKIQLRSGRLLYGRGQPARDMLYILLRGKAALISDDSMQDDSKELFPGAVLGSIEFMTNANYECGVRCLTECEFAALTAKQLNSMPGREFADLTLSMSRQLCPLILQFLHHGFRKRWFPAGKSLYVEGGPVDSFFVVVSGRLQLFQVREDGKRHSMLQIGRSDCVGEMSLLAGQRQHSNTCITVRDSEVVEVPAASFEKLHEKYPQTIKVVAKTMAHRLRNVMQSATSPSTKRASIVTVAIVASNTDVAEKFTAKLSIALDEHGSSAVLRGTEMKAMLGDSAELPSAPNDFNYRSRVTRLLAELEENNRFLLFFCDPTPTEWSRCCIRQADLILIVAPADAEDCSPGSVEQALLWDVAGEPLNLANKDLVLIHDRRAQFPRNTRRWFPRRKLHTFHHVKESRSADYRRVARYIAGKTVGLVLGGGGARGLAHLGAIKAIEEMGVDIDYVGGTSQGAFMAGLYAMHMTYTGIKEPTYRMAVAMGSVLELLKDATLPLMSYFSGKRFNESMKSFFGDVRIEDLWIPYYCVTTNVSRADICIHRTGMLWIAVRASMTLLEYLPPMYFGDSLLIDGGYVSNLPVDIMRDTLAPDLVIAIDVETKDADTFRNLANFGEYLSGFWLLWYKLKLFLTPLAKHASIPRYGEIVNSLSFISHARSIRNLQKQGAIDIYVVPKLGNVKLLDYDRIEEIAEIGFVWTKVRIVEFRLRNQQRSMHHSLSESDLSNSRRRSVSAPLAESSREALTAASSLKIPRTTSPVGDDAILKRLATLDHHT